MTSTPTATHFISTSSTLGGPSPTIGLAVGDLDRRMVVVAGILLAADPIQNPVIQARG